MRVFVKAKPRAHREAVEELDPTHFVVAVREPPDKGLANLAIRRALAEHLGVPASQLELVSGFASREKVFRVY